MGRNAQIRRARKALINPKATRRFPGGRDGAEDFLAKKGKTPSKKMLAGV